MSNLLFRKDALERLKRPESLNDVMLVVPSSSWLALLAVAIVIIFATVWAFTAHIAVKVDAYGFIGSASTEAYVSVLEAPKIKSGMKAEMIMSHLHSEDHGYLIARTGEVNELYAHDVPHFIKRIFRTEAVKVILLPLHPIRPGIFFHALITVAHNRPIDYVMPIFRRILARD